MLKMMGMVVLAAGMMLGGAMPSVAASGAVAIDEGGVSLGISGNAGSRAEAGRQALRQCRNRGGSACSVRYRWSGPGCVFATLGANQFGQTGFGIGPSPQAALANCITQGAGLICQPPIMSCNQW